MSHLKAILPPIFLGQELMMEAVFKVLILKSYWTQKALGSHCTFLNFTKCRFFFGDTFQEQQLGNPAFFKKKTLKCFWVAESIKISLKLFIHYNAVVAFQWNLGNMFEQSKHMEMELSYQKWWLQECWWGWDTEGSPEQMLITNVWKRKWLLQIPPS